MSSKLTIILFGIALFCLLRISSPPENLTYNGWLIANLLFLMTLWWLTQAVPLSITALLPIILVPILSDIDIKDVTKPYANPIIFLLLGGFIIAQGLEKSSLHKRIALRILLYLGSNKENILKGFIISTSFLSMWLSNTATCLLMLPIAVSILDKVKLDNDFKKILFLSIAYSSSIGGMGTLIGTAPNAILAGYLSENFNLELSFFNWMLFSLPLVFILLFLLWTYFKIFIPKSHNDLLSENIIKNQYEDLGRILIKEKIALFIIILTIFLWVLKKQINIFFDLKITDTNIAIFGAVLFFLIPTGKNKFILDINWFKEIPWNILLLFGGGLSLASLVTSSGLAVWLGDFLFFLNNFNLLLIILSIALLISFLTEITSNTATTLLFLPIVMSFASSNNLDILSLALPVVLAASCAFMMPIATPPNAIVFSKNTMTISYMARIGFFMNVITIVISSVWIYFCSSLISI